MSCLVVTSKWNCPSGTPHGSSLEHRLAVTNDDYSVNIRADIFSSSCDAAEARTIESNVLGGVDWPSIVEH
jgi:hypothetical protein